MTPCSLNPKTVESSLTPYFLLHSICQQSLLGLGNPMDGGAWWAAVHGVTKIQT